MLTLERRAHLRLCTGLLLTAIFDGVLLGACFAPQVGVLFGFSNPESVHDSYWDSWFVRAIEIVFLVLTLGAFTLMFSGVVRCRLIRYDAA